MTILNLLELNEAQREAATAPGDVVVTAGAGSGKTRTLVARYLARLENGVPLRAIVAITFTVKAAREMRTRIRRTLTGWLERDECATPPERWRDALAELDAAHIGTLHSLCAQILRAHPVEAARLGHLPGFGVLEEGHTAVLQARAIEEALVWAAEDEAASRLFNLLGEFPLRRTITTLLEQRLDTQAAFERLTDDPLEGWADAVLGWLRETLRRPGWQEALADEVASGFYWHISSAKASSLKLERFEGGVPGAIETAVAHALSIVEAVRAGEFAPTPPPGGLLQEVQGSVVVRWKTHHHD